MIKGIIHQEDITNPSLLTKLQGGANKSSEEIYKYTSLGTDR